MEARNLSLQETDEKSYQIHEILLSLGIPPNVRGYCYIVYSLELIDKNPDLMYSITKGLYIDIAKKFNTTPSAIERGIRHAIHSAWQYGNTKLLNSIFRNHLKDKRIPSNSVFLARLYYYIEKEL